MSIKISTVFYPHIVKEYTSVEQFYTENGYEEFYSSINEVQDRHIDRSDTTIYQESISEDGFEAIVTVSFANNADYEAYNADLQANEANVANAKQPIYREDHSDANDEIHLF